MSAPATLMAALGSVVLIATYVTWIVRDVPKAQARRKEQS